MKPAMGKKAGNICAHCSDQTRVTRNCNKPLRGTDVRDTRQPELPPRCATLGFNRNGKPHSAFPPEAPQLVNGILAMSGLLERASLSEMDASVYELSLVVSYERGVAAAHWNAVQKKQQVK